MIELRTELLNPAVDPRWTALLRSDVEGGPFHHPAWLRLLRDQYHYRVSALCVSEPSGAILAGLPLAEVNSRLTGRRLVALPFSDICGPLQSPSAPPETIDALGLALDAERKKRGLDLEIHASLPGLGGAHAGQPFLHHILPLSRDLAAVTAAFSKSQVRRGIRKAQREGVTVKLRSDAQALEQFFALHVQTRRHQGVPTQPKRFIRRFVGLFEQGLGWVALATWESRPIAAAVFLACNGTVIYKYGASDRCHLDKRPNNLLFMEAIRRASEGGARVLDFGRTDPDNEGLAAFKRAWGADERQLRYTHLAAQAPDTRGGVPAPVTKLIRRSPPAVGRWIGAALYRHFG